MILQKFSGMYRINQLHRNTLKLITISKNLSSLAESAQPNEAVKTKPQSSSPFLKNTFAGRFDKNVLVFPESLSKSELTILDEKIKKIEEFSQQNEGMINEELMIKMKELGLLSLQSNADHGEWSSTQMLRLFETVNPLLCDFLFHHNLLGSKCIELYGSDEAKASVIPQLNSGNSSIAFCFHEEHSGDDLSQIATTAECSHDGTTYLLNGRKTWVKMVAGITDFFVVFAKVKKLYGTRPFAEMEDDPVTAFLIHKQLLPSIQLEGPLPSIHSANTTATYNLCLSNVRVPSSHMLGHVGNGFKIAVDLIYGGLFLTTSQSSSMLKKALGHVSKHCIEHKQFKKSLVDLPLIQEKLGRMSVDAYVMESMAYVTAGLLDAGCQGDIFVESACTQVFSSEHVRRGLEEGLQVVGKGGCYDDNPVAKLLTSLSYDCIVSNDMLRRYIALNCLQHAGILMQESFRKFRNPLNHLSHLLKEGYKAIVVDSKHPPLIHRLHHSVHPDLSICAESLETRVLKIQHLVTKYWTTFFNKLEEEELALKRFADIAINIYAITCCLARATRAKSIGLMNADYEIIMCQAVITRLIKKIDDDLLNLDLGDHSNGEIFLRKLAGATFKKQAYALEHPLTRNW